MKTCVIDIETSVNNVGEDAVGDEKGSPFCPMNTIELIGVYQDEQYREYVPQQMGSDAWMFNADMLIGHNIRFDLMYLLKTYPWFEEWLHDPEHYIWDTQLAEYLLTGHTSQWASLDDVSVKYGGTLKDDRIKKMWDDGVKTEDIPAELLSSYLKHDVMNTHLVFQAQMKEARKLNMFPLLKSQFHALKATLEMWKNGLRFDKEMAIVAIEETYEVKERLEKEIKDVFASTHPKLPREKIEAGSNDMLSRTLFGGRYVYRGDEPLYDDDGKPVVYKSGKQKGLHKTKRVDKEDVIMPWFAADPKWETKKAGIYSVGDDVISSLQPQSKEQEEVLSLIKEFRGVCKDLDTYFTGYSALAWPENDMWFIHGSLNHCATGTGRLSSSRPNLQNMSAKVR